jgi:hypothetical protein
MGILRDRMIEEMKLRNFSAATQESYVYAVSRLARYHNKSPDQLSNCLIATTREVKVLTADCNTTIVVLVRCCHSRSDQANLR